MVPCHPQAAATDKLHRPVRVEAPSVDHAVHAGKQGLEHPGDVLGMVGPCGNVDPRAINNLPGIVDPWRLRKRTG